MKVKQSNLFLSIFLVCSIATNFFGQNVFNSSFGNANLTKFRNFTTQSTNPNYAKNIGTKNILCYITNIRVNHHKTPL